MSTSSKVRGTSKLLSLALLLGVGLAQACSSSSSGENTGGSGGSPSGGSNGGSGGKATGGSNGGSGGKAGSGGSSGGSGGKAGSGGSSGGSGGKAGSGGSSGGSGGSSGGSTGGTPAGYYSTKNWGVSSVDWHGCVWTGIDKVASTTTKVSPQDFTNGVPEGGPYHVTGSVFADYEAVALLGFNLNEATNGKADQCKYNPTAGDDGPPGVEFPSNTTGLAVNWTQGSTTLIRIQIQASDGGTNADHRWCFNVADAGGPSFAPFNKFNTKCWGQEGSSTNPLGDYYDGKTPISAVVFLIAGDKTAEKKFDFTVNGFAPGSSAADAPKGGTVECGKQTGTLGAATASTDASMARAKVTGADCKQYIIQNNNWGNPTGSTQIIDFTGSTFTVKSSTGSSTGQGVPASFPSAYIGGNGNIAGGTYSTWSSSGLPKKVSDIKSVNSHFEWSGGKGGGDYNATYDIWFAASPPTEGGYEDGVSALVMLWFYKPASRSPIGHVVRSYTDSKGNAWDVWVGPRNTTAKGTSDTGRPVISYVAKQTLSKADLDLKEFFSDAAKNGAADKSAGGTSSAFSESLYLTDVFAGFEIWSGGDGAGLKSTNFSAVVQ